MQMGRAEIRICLWTMNDSKESAVENMGLADTQHTGWDIAGEFQERIRRTRESHQTAPQTELVS